MTIGQAGTGMLYALGLGDRLVGTSLWTNDDAAAAITEGGVPISDAYLSQLRTGQIDRDRLKEL